MEALADAEETAVLGALSGHRRRAAGMFFTPPALVGEVLERVGPLIPSGRRLAIIDPACGAGAFLGAAAIRYRKARLFGLELEESIARLCARRVPGALVRVGDALRGGLDALLASVPKDAFQLWVGNPPYNGTSPVLADPAMYRSLRRLLPEGFSLPRGTSLREDYVFFLLLALEQLRRSRGGVLAFVTSATLLDAFLYSPLREALLRELQLEEVWDLGRGVFTGTQVRTCVTVWRWPGGVRRPVVYRARVDSDGESGFAAEELQRRPRVLFSPDGPGFLLRPVDRRALALEEAWARRGESISELVRVSFPGLKTRFDELLVDGDAEKLFERVSEFLEVAQSSQEGAMRAFAERHGLVEHLVPKLVALQRYAKERSTSRGRVLAERTRIRPFLRLRPGAPEWMQEFCYLDRALIPRGDHRLRGDYDPHRCAKKLVFNVRELPLWAAWVDTPGCVHDYRHTRFAPLYVPLKIWEGGLEAAREGGSLGPEVPNLSPAGRAWARRIGGPEAVLRAVAGFVNSIPVQSSWAPALGASREISVPIP